MSSNSEAFHSSVMNLIEQQQETSYMLSNVSYLGTSPTAKCVLIYMCVAVVVMLTVTGNLLVIISICHFKQLQTPTNFLLLSLAMADFLVGVTVMPIYFSMLLHPQKCFDTLSCTIYNIAELYFTCVSIYNVALIAVDRCFSLTNPFHYSLKMTVKVTSRITAILWLYSLIYNIVLSYFNGNISGPRANITCGECIIIVNEEWSVIDFTVVLVFPCAIIVITYLKIFSIAKKQANKIRSIQKFSKIDHGKMVSERKAAKTLGILVAVFLLCLVPYYVSAFLDVHVRKRSVHLAVSITLTLVYLNSSINPIIYALFYPWFQRSVRIILTFRICSTESSTLNVLELNNSE